MKKLLLAVITTCLLIPTKTFAQRISEGPGFTLVLCADGSAQAWGANYVGQLGDNGTGEDSPIPVDVYEINNLVSIDAGTTFSLALKNDGSVWAWGDNTNGACGDGTYETRFAPVQVYGPDSVTFFDNVQDIAAGNQVALALKNDGTVWSWGSGYRGVAGVNDPNGIHHLYPVQVTGTDGIGFLENIIEIEVSDYSAYALKSDGTVWAWGENMDAQLGDGTTINRFAPIQIPELTDVVHITAGTSCAYAIKSDGTVWGWGGNDYGKLGTGTLDFTYSTPVQMLGVESAVAVAAGQHFVVILNNEGGVFTCGNNSDGQLGDGTVEDRSIADPVPGLSSIAEISAGGKTSLVMDNDGNLFAWGDNIVGQIGDGTLSDKWTPTYVASACSMLLETNHFAHAQNSLVTYPNPGSNYVFVETDGLLNHTMNLFDINGTLISTLIVNNPISSIDVSNLPAGIYVLRDSTDLTSTKIIVE